MHFSPEQARLTMPTQKNQKGATSALQCSEFLTNYFRRKSSAASREKNMTLCTQMMHAAVGLSARWSGAVV
jgi:hypothetical protein